MQYDRFFFVDVETEVEYDFNLYKESWVLMNWCFWTVVLEKNLESPLDCRRANQFILKEISPEYSLEGLMLKLKLQYFGHLIQRTDSLEKTLILGKIEGRRRRGRQRMDGWMASLTRWTWVWATWAGRPGVLQSMGSQRVKYNWATELNWLAGMKWLWNKDIHLASESREISFLPLSQAASENLRVFEIF